jgi:hypothetical protein
LPAQASNHTARIHDRNRKLSDSRSPAPPPVVVNGAEVVKIDRLPAAGSITRHSIQCLCTEREVEFDAKLLKSGANSLELTVPAGPVHNGVIDRQLCLELANSGTP